MPSFDVRYHEKVQNCTVTERAVHLSRLSLTMLTSEEIAARVAQEEASQEDCYHGMDIEDNHDESKDKGDFIHSLLKRHERARLKFEEAEMNADKEEGIVIKGSIPTEVEMIEEFQEGKDSLDSQASKNDIKIEEEKKEESPEVNSKCDLSYSEIVHLNEMLTEERILSLIDACNAAPAVVAAKSEEKADDHEDKGRDNIEEKKDTTDLEAGAFRYLVTQLGIFISQESGSFDIQRMFLLSEKREQVQNENVHLHAVKWLSNDEEGGKFLLKSKALLSASTSLLKFMALYHHTVQITSNIEEIVEKAIHLATDFIKDNFDKNWKSKMKKIHLMGVKASVGEKFEKDNDSGGRDDLGGKFATADAEVDVDDEAVFETEEDISMHSWMGAITRSTSFTLLPLVRSSVASVMKMISIRKQPSRIVNAAIRLAYNALEADPAISNNAEYLEFSMSASYGAHALLYRQQEELQRLAQQQSNTSGNIALTQEQEKVRDDLRRAQHHSMLSSSSLHALHEKVILLLQLIVIKHPESQQDIMISILEYSSKVYNGKFQKKHYPINPYATEYRTLTQKEEKMAGHARGLLDNKAARFISTAFATLLRVLQATVGTGLVSQESSSLITNAAVEMEKEKKNDKTNKIKGKSKGKGKRQTKKRKASDVSEEVVNVEKEATTSVDTPLGQLHLTEVKRLIDMYIKELVKRCSSELGEEYQKVMEHTIVEIENVLNCPFFPVAPMILDVLLLRVSPVLMDSPTTDSVSKNDNKASTISFYISILGSVAKMAHSMEMSVKATNDVVMDCDIQTLMKVANDMTSRYIGIKIEESKTVSSNAVPAEVPTTADTTTVSAGDENVVNAATSRRSGRSRTLSRKASEAESMDLVNNEGDDKVTEMVDTTANTLASVLGTSTDVSSGKGDLLAGLTDAVKDDNNVGFEPRVILALREKVFKCSDVWLTPVRRRTQRMMQASGVTTTSSGRKSRSRANKGSVNIADDDRDDGEEDQLSSVELVQDISHRLTIVDELRSLCMEALSEYLGHSSLSMTAENIALHYHLATNPILLLTCIGGQEELMSYLDVNQIDISLDAKEMTLYLEDIKMFYVSKFIKNMLPVDASSASGSVGPGYISDTSSEASLAYVYHLILAQSHRMASLNNKHHLSTYMASEINEYENIIKPRSLCNTSANTHEMKGGDCSTSSSTTTGRWQTSKTSTQFTDSYRSVTQLQGIYGWMCKCYSETVVSGYMHKIFGYILRMLLQVGRQPSLIIRVKTIKIVGKLVNIDQTLMSRADVREFVLERLYDVVISVREETVKVLGSCVLYGQRSLVEAKKLEQKAFESISVTTSSMEAMDVDVPAFEGTDTADLPPNGPQDVQYLYGNQYIDALLQCLNDRGVSVRRAVVNVIRDILQQDPLHPRYAELCIALLDRCRVETDSPALVDNIKAAFYQIWLQPQSISSSSSSSSNSVRSGISLSKRNTKRQDHVDNVCCQIIGIVNVCIENGHRGNGIRKYMADMLREILIGLSQATHATSTGTTPHTGISVGSTSPTSRTTSIRSEGGIDAATVANISAQSNLIPGISNANKKQAQSSIQQFDQICKTLVDLLVKIEENDSTVWCRLDHALNKEKYSKMVNNGDKVQKTSSGDNKDGSDDSVATSIDSATIEGYKFNDMLVSVIGCLSIACHARPSSIVSHMSILVSYLQRHTTLSAHQQAEVSLMVSNIISAVIPICVNSSYTMTAAATRGDMGCSIVSNDGRNNTNSGGLVLPSISYTDIIENLTQIIFRSGLYNVHAAVKCLAIITSHVTMDASQYMSIANKVFKPIVELALYNAQEQRVAQGNITSNMSESSALMTLGQAGQGDNISRERSKSNSQDRSAQPNISPRKVNYAQIQRCLVVLAAICEHSRICAAQLMKIGLQASRRGRGSVLMSSNNDVNDVNKAYLKKQLKQEESVAQGDICKMRSVAAVSLNGASYCAALYCLSLPDPAIQVRAVQALCRTFIGCPKLILLADGKGLLAQLLTRQPSGPSVAPSMSGPSTPSESPQPLQEEGSSSGNPTIQPLIYDAGFHMKLLESLNVMMQFDEKNHSLLLGGGINSTPVSEENVNRLVSAADTMDSLGALGGMRGNKSGALGLLGNSSDESGDEDDDVIASSVMTSSMAESDVSAPGYVLVQHTNHLALYMEEYDASLRLEALKLVGTLLRQGILCPLDAVVSLVSLQCDEEPLIREQALEYLVQADIKHPTFLENRIVTGIEKAYKVQTKLLGQALPVMLYTGNNFSPGSDVSPFDISISPLSLDYGLDGMDLGEEEGLMEVGQHWISPLAPLYQKCFRSNKKRYASLFDFILRRVMAMFGEIRVMRVRMVADLQKSLTTWIRRQTTDQIGSNDSTENYEGNLVSLLKRLDIIINDVNTLRNLIHFMSCTLAHLPYETLNEPLYIISWIRKNMSIDASNLISEEVMKAIQTVAGLQTTVDHTHRVCRDDEIGNDRLAAFTYQNSPILSSAKGREVGATGFGSTDSSFSTSAVLKEKVPFPFYTEGTIAHGTKSTNPRKRSASITTNTVTPSADNESKQSVMQVDADLLNEPQVQGQADGVNENVAAWFLDRQSFSQWVSIVQDFTTTTSDSDHTNGMSNKKINACELQSLETVLTLSAVVLLGGYEAESRQNLTALKLYLQEVYKVTDEKCEAYEAPGKAKTLKLDTSLHVDIEGRKRLPNFDVYYAKLKDSHSTATTGTTGKADSTVHDDREGTAVNVRTDTISFEMQLKHSPSEFTTCVDEAINSLARLNVINSIMSAPKTHYRRNNASRSAKARSTSTTRGSGSRVGSKRGRGKKQHKKDDDSDAFCSDDEEDYSEHEDEAIVETPAPVRGPAVVSTHKSSNRVKNTNNTRITNSASGTQKKIVAAEPVITTTRSGRVSKRKTIEEYDSDDFGE